MRVLLDTDIVSNLLSPRPSALLQRRLSATPAPQYLSAISLAEILYGFERRGLRRLRAIFVEEILPALAVLPVGEAVAAEYAVLRAHLERTGQPLPDADLLIAATAVAHDLPLITANVRHFARFPQLRVDNWLEG